MLNNEDLSMKITYIEILLSDLIPSFQFGNHIAIGSNFFGAHSGLVDLKNSKILFGIKEKECWIVYNSVDDLIHFVIPAFPLQEDYRKDLESLYTNSIKVREPMSTSQLGIFFRPVSG